MVKTGANAWGAEASAQPGAHSPGGAHTLCTSATEAWIILVVFFCISFFS